MDPTNLSCFSRTMLNFEAARNATNSGSLSQVASPLSSLEASLFIENEGWRREWDSNPRGRDAQRLSCQSTNVQMGSRGRRFNHSAIPAQLSAKTERVLNHFQTNRRLGATC